MRHNPQSRYAESHRNRDFGCMNGSPLPEPLESSRTCGLFLSSDRAGRPAIARRRFVLNRRSKPLHRTRAGGPGCEGPAARSRQPIARGSKGARALFPSCTPPIMELPQARTSTTTAGAQGAPRLSSSFRVPPAAGPPRPAADGHVVSNQGPARRSRLVRRHSERENPSPLSSSRWPRLPAPAANDGPLPCSPIRRPPGRFY